MPVTSMGLLLLGSDQMLLRGSLPWIGNWRSDQQNIRCLYMQLWPHSKPLMELMALVTFWEVVFPWLSLIFIHMTANSLGVFLVDLGEVVEENDSFSCSMWVCESMDLKSYRNTERYSGRRNCTEDFVSCGSNRCSFRSAFLYLAVSVRNWY